MNTKEVIDVASRYLSELPGKVFDVLSVSKPVSPIAAVNLSKVISKLSPLIGNMIEINTCEFLNEKKEFMGIGKWRRQDPGFPDVIFDGGVLPVPGFEIKAWFPLATEITARFKDSQNHFLDDRTYVAMIAWLPEFLIYGRPKIIGVVIASGASVAKARDDHYHNPPDYLVLEPEDTSRRARNLQQTNTNGYKWQEDGDYVKEKELEAMASRMVENWGVEFKNYSPSFEYQKKVRELLGKFKYRLDTNYAKMDRIGHPKIDEFSRKVYETNFHGRTIGEWNRLLSGGGDRVVKEALSDAFSIYERNVDGILVKGGW